MRFKSKPVGGFQIFAVTGTNTISFAIRASDEAKKGLLGFAIERSAEGEPKRRLPGFKVFRSLIPKPDKTTRVSTWDHPVQSFVWDDFTGKPMRDYEYDFHPLRGEPQNLDRSARPIRINVRTEALYSDGEHDIFFNRGVASSQAYALQFGNKKPSQLPEEQAQKALQWLTRDLDDAMLRFIGNARKGDTLLCCFYEFRYAPVVSALKTAIDAGVDVRIIIDAKVNERTDKNGVFHPSFPRVDNLAAIEAAGIPTGNVIERDANPTNIQHNKFMVLLKGKKEALSEVWTGSTNLSMGGVTGQTNVGHWVRNDTVAERFKEYWNVLANNPGASKGDGRTVATRKKGAYRLAVEALGDAPATLEDIPEGVTVVFSPRSKPDVLGLYVTLVDSAEAVSCVTLAFGVNELFKEQLKDNRGEQHLVFLLLEKKDEPNKRSRKPFVAINATNNVYKAWGAFIDDPIYQWVHETNARQLAFNSHVSYIHSKFLLMDPLGDDPIVITGSANFSVPSTRDNDENMLIIRGNKRVADIYFTEFNRLFNHYYFRAVHEDAAGQNKKDTDASLFLDETGSKWLEKYAPGKLRAKRLALYTKMAGFTTL